MNWTLNTKCCFSTDKESLEESNLVYLPESILVYLDKDNNILHNEDSNDDIMNNMNNNDINEPNSPKLKKVYYQITNINIGITTYVGVREFTSMSDTIILPFWLMQYLAIDENQKLEVKIIDSVPKGELIKLAPLEKSFFNLPDTDSILETMLSKFPILHQGLIFQLNIFNNTYNFEVIETSTKEFLYECIDIIDTDLKVDIVNRFINDKPIPIPLENNTNINPNTNINSSISSGIKIGQNPDIINSILQNNHIENNLEKKDTKFPGKGYKLGSS